MIGGIEPHVPRALWRLYVFGDVILVRSILMNHGKRAVRIVASRAWFLRSPDTRPVNPRPGYDLSLDSQLFLMAKLERRKPAPVTDMILVLNWFEKLKRLVPTGK